MMQSRNTLQRELVLQQVKARHDHPSADDIYCDLHEQYTSISRATVYRNLSLLADQGAILRVANPAGADRFDFNISPHHHMHCTGCGGVFDVNLPAMPQIMAQAKAPPGAQIDSFTILYSGLCAACAKHRR